MALVGPFQIVCRVATIAYILDLPALYAGIHPIFYISRFQAYQGTGGDRINPSAGPGPVTIDGEE